MKVRRIIASIILMSIFLLTSCSSNLKSENSKLTSENKRLKQQLDSANQEIKYQKELYELRHTLDIDIKTHDILYGIMKGDMSTLKKTMASNVTISGNQIISKDKNGDSSEFDIPKELLNLRQRAYMFSDDKKELYSIYELYPLPESILKTLNVHYILDNGEWKLNFIKMDE